MLKNTKKVNLLKEQDEDILSDQKSTIKPEKLQLGESASYEQSESKNIEESQKFYDQQYEELNNLSDGEKEYFEQMNCISSVTLVNQLEDRNNIMRVYLLKMAKIMEEYDS